MNTICVIEDQILKKLSKIQTTKSPDPDQMHPKLTRELADVLTKPLSGIFNTSLQTRTLFSMPTIFKKGDK